MKHFSLRFPTVLHEQAAEIAYRFFKPVDDVDTVLVVNSCARGQAIPESDLDMAILVRPEMTGEAFARLEALWQAELAVNDDLIKFRASGDHAHIHLDLIRGEYHPEAWDDGGGPDWFEVSIGNSLAYSAPLHTSGPFFQALRAQYLPYYDEDLRLRRLAMVQSACRYDLDHVPFFVRRELYFQAFDRLYKSFQEFLQALFISRKVYPLAYNKWIHMQVEEWLGLPDLYRELPGVLSVPDLQSGALIERAGRLSELLDEWVA